MKAKMCQKHVYLKIRILEIIREFFFFFLYSERIKVNDFNFSDVFLRKDF